MIITLSSMKGGVGKSSDAILLANCLAAMEYKVLVVDLDPNNSATMYYTTGIENIEQTVQIKNVFESLTHRTAVGYIVPTRVKQVDIIPSSLYLSDIRTIDYHVLKKILPANDYDYIVVDTAPTYDNHTQSAIFAADYILTPVEFTTFNMTTSCYLQTKMYDELPEKISNWYLVYSHWQEKLEPFASSLQSQFVNQFESRFDNILNVKIPHTPAVDKYTQSDEHVSVNSKIVGSRRLAHAFNDLAKMITGSEKLAEVF